MEVVPWSWNFEWNFGNKTGGWVGHGGGFWEISAVFVVVSVGNLTNTCLPTVTDALMVP